MEEFPPTVASDDEDTEDRSEDRDIESCMTLDSIYPADLKLTVKYRKRR